MANKLVHICKVLESIAIINTKKVLAIILFPIITISYFIKTTQAAWDINQNLKKRKK